MKATLTIDKVTVYRKDRTSKAGKPYSTYSIKVSSKNSSGEWESAFMNVQFKKGVSVNNKSKIKVNNSFPVPNVYGDVANIQWMITDFEVLEDGDKAEVKSGAEFMEIPDDMPDAVPWS